MADNLQQRTFSGMIWTFAQHFSLEGFAFIQGIILARLLVPKDYGLVAMVHVFFAIARVFIDSGFVNALIRKKHRQEIDYSTVFVTNVVLTAFSAILLCFFAPFIASFYKEPILNDIVRANALLLVLNSVNAVQATRLRINLQFKVLGFISVVNNVAVGIGTIIFAFLGFGVWSLIYPSFLGPFLKYGLFWYFQRWRPKLDFSWRIWRDYFSFGSKLLVSSLLDRIWGNMYPLIIGKSYSAIELGYYSRAKGYAAMPANTFQGVLGSVTFPVLCSIQNDDARLRDAYRRLIRISGFIVFPMLIGLAALAKPVIIVLITDKWAASIPYLAVSCFSVMLRPIHVLNLNLLQVKGRSDLFLRLEILKKVLALLILLITMRYSVLIMCIGQVVSSYLMLYINTYYTGKLIKLSYFMQMKDLLPSFVYSLSMGAIIYIVTLFIPNLVIQLLFGIILGIAYYLFISMIFKSPELAYIKVLLRNHVLKKYGRK